MPDFYTNELISIEKEVDNRIPQRLECDLNEYYEIDRCIEWVKSNNFTKVCLQFPDHLLPDSFQLALSMQERLGFPVYVMGDTAYESCCIDYISAAHVNADAIIHFGPVCFSQTAATLPYLNIYEKHFIDIDKFKNEYEKLPKTCILVDTPFIYKIDSLREMLKTDCVPLDKFEVSFSADRYIFLGSNMRKLENICFCQKLSDKDIYVYEPSGDSPKIEKFHENKAVIKRRYFLAEKIKDSKIVGIIMGTLAVSNYLVVLERVKKILKMNGKKYYVISVGKINVSKLANFPEMDVYVVITCAMNEVYDSKEFHKPIATPYDVERALNPDAQNLQFTYNYNSYLDQVAPIEDLKIDEGSDVSLLTGNLRLREVEEVTESDGTVSIKEGRMVSGASGAGYLAGRSWSGLVQDVGETEPARIKEGRSGIAQGYDSEIK